MSTDISVVLDTGSKNTKAGFAGESFPRCNLPTTVARARYEDFSDNPEIYFGNEAIQKRGISKYTSPVHKGMIEDWDEMEKFWHHVYYRELHVAPETSPTLIAVHPLTQKRDKERIAEILFESFIVKDLYLAVSPALVVHASGRTSGVIYENGHSCCYTIPVFEGFPLKHATVCSNINGKVLTDRLQQLLKEVGYSFTTPHDIDLLDKIKENLCFTTSNYETEVAEFAFSKEKVRYELPDGQHVFIGEERFQCPEVMFQPHLQGLKCPNIVDDIRLSISRSELEYKELFYKNIILSGGTSMMEGLSDRLFRELRKRGTDASELSVKIDAMPSRNIAAWLGGSILASLSSYNGFWMSRQEYEDDGAERVHYKFF